MPEYGRREEWKEARDAIEKRNAPTTVAGQGRKEIIPASAWGTDGNICMSNLITTATEAAEAKHLCYLRIEMRRLGPSSFRV